MYFSEMDHVFSSEGPWHPKISVCVRIHWLSIHTLNLWNEEISFFPGLLSLLLGQQRACHMALPWSAPSLMLPGWLPKYFVSKQIKKKTLPTCMHQQWPCDGKKIGCGLKYWENCNRVAQNHPSLTENWEGYVHGTNSPQYWENRRDPWFNEALLNFSK